MRKWEVSITYSRTWVVEADSEEEMVEKANQEFMGPDAETEGYSEMDFKEIED